MDVSIYNFLDLLISVLTWKVECESFGLGLRATAPTVVPGGPHAVAWHAQEGASGIFHEGQSDNANFHPLFSFQQIVKPGGIRRETPPPEGAPSLDE